MKDADKERIILVAPTLCFFVGAGVVHCNPIMNGSLLSDSICNLMKFLFRIPTVNLDKKTSLAVVGGSASLATGFFLLMLTRWASAEARQKSAEALREKAQLQTNLQSTNDALLVEVGRGKSRDQIIEEQKIQIDNLTRVNSKLGADLRSKQHDDSSTNPAGLFRRVS